MAEFSELNDKLADIRSQKTKVSRMLREKEEELGKNLLFFFCCLAICCKCRELYFTMSSIFIFLLLNSLLFVIHCIESTLQKLDGLRQEVRNADRKKREVSFFKAVFF